MGLLERGLRAAGFSLEPTFLDTVVLLELRGVYDMRRIAAQYADLPAVTGTQDIELASAEAELCASRTGERYEYVVDRTSGECPGLCYHEAHHFVSDAPGQVSAFEVWRSHQGQPEPAWFRYRCP